jgi:exonuclease III
MATLLRGPRVMDYDVLAIQEPWRNPFMSTTHHPAKAQFHLCYPAAIEEGPARVCFFVNKRLDTTTWQFKSHTRDACSLQIQYEKDHQARGCLHIHNIYNPGQATEDRESVLPLVVTLLETNQLDEQIALGDFNLHHRSWGGERVVREDQEAEELRTIMDRFGLTNTLHEGAITYEDRNAQSTIDLCWITVGLLDRLIKSIIDRELDHDSDHFPITTILDMSIKHKNMEPKRNWKKLDEKKLCEALRQTLPQPQRPRTKTALDRCTEGLVEAIDEAVEKVLPKTRQSTKAREGWTDECSRTLAESKRLRRAHCKDHTEESWEAYRAARNTKARTIKKALRTAHREKIAAASDSPEALWRLTKWARGRTTLPPSVTPSIRCPQTEREVTEASEKAEVFRRTFFPRPPVADLRDTHGVQYTGQISQPPITEKEILEAIRSTSPLKAPGPDGLPNRVLQVTADIIVGHLEIIFNQSLRISYCPAHFRSSITVVLRKPDKDDYTLPKAYRPIALLNTIGKIMDAVLARRLSYLVEAHNVLPNTHIGGRKLRSTEHALHLIIEKIYKAWNVGRGRVASLLLLDVSGAFDNVSHERLLHNLRTRRVDEKLVRWLASFLKERWTRMTMDDFTSKEHSISTGIPQGSPLSPILYIFYNAGLLETCELDLDTTATGYIDDAAILACGDTTAETCAKLKVALQKAQNWATAHASKFAPDKFQLAHFTRSRTRFDIEQEVETEWGNIMPKTTCKYLGVVMDHKLDWKPHVEKIKQKVSKSVNALASLGSSTWGISMSDMRKIYNGVVVPQMMYACSVWSNSRSNGTPYTKKTLITLRSIQARGARAICGAFRATSRAALDIETHLLPVAQQIEKHNAHALSRIISSNMISDFDGIANGRFDRVPRKTPYTSPLRSIHRQREGLRPAEPYHMETIPPFVAPPWWLGPTIHIEEEACARSTHDREATKGNVCIYTDGSSIGGHVGAAAVCLDTGQTSKTYMGTDATSTVYAAEL